MLNAANLGHAGLVNIDHSFRWSVKNGYIVNPFYYPPFDLHKKWDYVTHWRELDEQSLQILSKRGYYKEDFQ